MMPSLTQFKDPNLSKLTRVRLQGGQELTLLSVRTSNMKALTLTTDSMMEKSSVSPTLRLALMKNLTEMLVEIHGPSTLMSHQVLSSTLTKFQMLSKFSQVQAILKVALSFKSSEHGSITNLNTVLSLIASSETQLCVRISTLP